MEPFKLLAQPWWVNLLILVPVLASWSWWGKPLRLDSRRLLWCGLFAASFAFVEAAVVIDLRAATNQLPGYWGTLAEVRRHAGDIYSQMQAVGAFPQSLLVVELVREAATIVMLLAVAVLSAPGHRERWAMFLWAFAIWDFGYYVFLRLTIGWPLGFTTPDVLFLIPVPWMAQVWFPLVVSGLTMLAVVGGTRGEERPYPVENVVVAPGRKAAASGHQPES